MNIKYDLHFVRIALLNIYALVYTVQMPGFFSCYVNFHAKKDIFFNTFSGNLFLERLKCTCDLLCLTSFAD